MGEFEQRKAVSDILKGCLAARGVGRVGNQIDTLQVRLAAAGVGGGGQRLKVPGSPLGLLVVGGRQREGGE